MSRSARGAAGATAALLVMTAAVGCRKKPPPEPPPPEVVVAPPIDRLAPGEIAEGAEKAFGFPIPRRMLVKAKFADSVIAAGDVTIEDVATYVRQRVVAAHVETGPSKTIFTKATLKSAPSQAVDIEIIANGTNSEMIVRDLTRPPTEPGLSEEERWKKAGMTPDGKVLDPTHLQ